MAEGTTTGSTVPRRQPGRSLRELPAVSLRVIPFTAGLHHGITSGLWTCEVDRYGTAFTPVARELGK
jgi:hypothetical protein